MLIQALTNLNQQGAAQLESHFWCIGAQREFNKAPKNLVRWSAKAPPRIDAIAARRNWALNAFGQLSRPVKAAAVGFTALARRSFFGTAHQAVLAGIAAFAPAAVAAGGAAKVLAGSLVIPKARCWHCLG